MPLKHKATYGEKVYFSLMVLERVHNGRCGVVARPCVKKRSAHIFSNLQKAEEEAAAVEWG